MSRQRSWVWLPVLASLIGCSPASPPAGRGSAGAARTGADLFNGNCSACHQANGQGIPGVYPSLGGSPTVLGDPQALALWVIGGQRAPTMPAGQHYPTAMPEFGWLEPEEAAALLTYIRSSFGNRASPVEPLTVAGALGRSNR